MKERTKTAGATRLLWSLLLGLSLALGLLWAVTPHSAAEAQAANPGFAVDLPDDATWSQMVPDDTAPVAHTSADAPAPAPPPGERTSPDFAPPHDRRMPPDGQQMTGGAPLFAPAGARSRGAASLIPPLPGIADLAVCMTSDRVWGIVGAGETATVTVDGAQMGAALADNIGFFWTTLYDGNGDRPNLSGGETVAIYHDGVQAASVTLRSISGQIDVLNDDVSGAIGGSGFPINVTIYAPWGEPSMTSYSQTVSTDGSGNFSADFTGIWDFVVWDEAMVAYIEGGVEVHRHVYPGNSLLVRPWPWNQVMGRAAPGTAVTVTIYLSDTTEKDSTTLTASATDGWYRWDAPTDIVDIVESDYVVVELAGGTVMSRTVDTLSLNVDAGDDRVTGEALPGATVRGLTSDLTPLGWRDVQTSTTASSPYTLEFGAIADILPGQWVGVLVADAEGDDLNLWNFSPSVEVNQTWNEVYGRGASPPGPLAGEHAVTLTLYSAASASESTYSKRMEWYGWYWFDENDGLPDIAPGDIVTVESEGFAWQGVVPVQTMTVQHDLDADQFTGSVEMPTERVELWGSSYWQDYLYPLAGSFNMLATATSPFVAAPPGFDVHYNLDYEVAHRTADDYLERISRETDGFGIIMPPNAVVGTLAPPGTAYNITLYDSGGGFKAQLTGTSEEPIGRTGWQDFGGTGEQIQAGDRVHVQSAAGFSQTLVVPDLTFSPDTGTDVVSGQGPADVLLYVGIDNQGRGFVPTDGDGQFAVAVDQLQDTWGNGDLEWGDRVEMEYIDENRTWVYYDYQWPQIIANYDMEGGSAVWGGGAIPGNTIYVTVTHPVSGVIATGTTYAGACDWCGPTDYRLDLPDGTIVPNNTVIVNWGDGLVDSTVIVAITANPDVDTDLVTGTAPANDTLYINAEHSWGDWIDISDIQVDASGVYTIDFGAEGWDIQYGDSFNIHYSAGHGHQTQYSFWVPAPELSINKWHSGNYARPGGIVVYGINYSNDGNGVAEDTLIVDTLPPNTAYAGDTSGLVPDVGAGGVITWNLGNLEAGDSGGFVVTLDLLGGLSDGDTIDQNCVVITTITPGDDPGDNDDCAGPVNVLDDEVEIDVDKWPNPDDPTPDQEFQYTIRPCNNRGAAAGPIWLTDTLPLWTTFVGWSSERGDTTYWTEVVTTGGQLVLYAPGLPGDTCEDLYLTLLLDAGAPISTTLENTVVVAAAGDVDPDNNERVNTNAHVSPPRYDMYLDKSIHNYVPVPGGWINYFFWYQNQGNMPAHIWITDTVPGGLSHDSANWGGNQPQQDDPFPLPTVIGDNLVWDLGVVPAGSSAWFHVQMNISGTLNPGDVLTNCATIGIDGDESTPEDNTSCYPVTLNPNGPNLRVTKWHDWHGDGQLGYQIKFENIGDETVSDVWITDTLPISTAWDGWWDGEGFNFDWNRLVSDTQSSNMLRWQFSSLDSGDRGWLNFSANLDEPGTRFRWYTNTVEITTPPDDANPDDNIYEDVAFSGGEVDWVDLDVYGTHIWGCGYSDPVIVTTAYEQRVYGGNCWNDDFSDPFQPGDVVTIEAGAATHPVVIHVPDPFDATADSNTDEVWGQIDALDHEWVTVDLDDGPALDMQTDGSGNYSATFLDIPRGGQGEVRYNTEIDYADVVFHRRFQTLDLIITADYYDDWVYGNYEAGHTVWITVTESDGVTPKATAVVTTGPIPEWGGSFFNIRGEDWSPSHPDIKTGDWVYGRVDNGYTNTVHVGAINGEMDVDTDTVSGTIHAPWFAPIGLTVHCEIHEENGPSIQVDDVDPDGGSFFCDFGGLWDIRPEHNVAVNYTEPDNDRVQTHIYVPTPYLRISKRADGSPGEGGNFAFQIQYWNDGDADAENTVISDTMLGGMTYITDTSGFPHAGGGSGPIVWELGTLPANSSGEFYVFVQVTAVESETITNVAHIATSHPYDQGGPEEKESEWSGHVQANATHLYATKDARTNDPAPGYDFVYTVDACNGGYDPTTNSAEATLTDTLPLSTSLVNWWADEAGWTEVINEPHRLVLSRPTIEAHRCSRIYLRVHLTSTAEPGDEICNTVTITASNDLEDDDNETTWCHNVGDPHTNLNVSKWWNWGQLVPGGEIRYHGGYNNNGNVPVDNVFITETLPVSTTLVQMWHYDQNWNLIGPITPAFVPPNHLVWDVGTVDNGYRGNFEVVLRVDDDATPGAILTNTVEISRLPDEDNYDDNVDTLVETLYDHGPNLRVRKWGSWDDWGENTRRASYNLTVENVGDEPVMPVVITDTYDSKMYLDGGIGLGFGGWWDWRDDPANHTFTITLEALYGGESVGVNFSTITDTEPLPFGLVFTNTAEVTLDPADTNPDDNFDDAILTTGPDLYVEKTLVAGDLLPGEIITFSLTFGNKREGWQWWWNMQGNAKLTDILPDGLEYVDSTRPPDLQQGSLVFWTLWPINAGDQHEILLIARVTDTAEGDDVFTNQVEIESDQPGDDIEPYYDNNEDTCDVAIALPRFEVGKVYESSRVAGMPVTYTLTVTNTGSEPGTNVVLSDTLPAGLAYGGSDGTFAGGDVTWAFANIAANGGTATGWFSGTLPCTLDTITNADYRVVGSDEGVDSPPGVPLAFSVIAPTLSPAFDQSGTVVVVSTPVYFTDTSATDGSGIVAWAWDFGDEKTGSGPTASHAYAATGDYTVTLTITGGCGYTATRTVLDAVTVITGVQTSIDPTTGGTLVYTDTQGNPTTVEVPGGAVSEPVTLLYTPVSSLTQPISLNLRFAGHAFDLDAYEDGTLQPGFVFSKPVTITIYYSDDDVQGISESSLYLYYWTGAVWEDAACGPYDRHPDENWLAVPICHLSRYGILGTSTHNIYLPLLMRNY